MKHFAFTAIVVALLALALFVPELSAKGRGGGRSRGGSSHSRGGSWFSRSSSSPSSSWHSSPSRSSSSSSSGGGNWFTNLFRSKPKPSSSSSSSSSSSNSHSSSSSSSHSSKPDYPRQPAHNPSYDKYDPPPSYSSLHPNHPPPSYGWAVNNAASGAGVRASNSGSGFRAGGIGAPPAPQQSVFHTFQPQNHQTSKSYHFIPVFMPHSHSTHHTYIHHYNRGSSSSSSSSASSDSSTTTTTTPAPIEAPIVYEMDTSMLQPNQYQTPKAALVVALNNMVVYGDLKPGQHLAMVIDEQYADPGQIPAKFLYAADEDDVVDYHPPKVTTSTTTTSTTTTSTTTVAPPIAEAVRDRRDDAQVLEHQWFGDVDGGI